jgi:hemerythrin-like metal-binding protein
MPSLPWSQELELGLPAMDRTHREFVELLAQAQRSSDTALPAAWDALIDHTQAHFAQEDEWMRVTRFASAKRHAVQHNVILQVLQEGSARIAEGNFASARVMTHVIEVWFPQHAQLLDSKLAAHMAQVGFDPDAAATPAAQSGAHGCGHCAKCTCSETRS